MAGGRRARECRRCRPKDLGGQITLQSVNSNNRTGFWACNLSPCVLRILLKLELGQGILVGLAGMVGAQT